MGSFIPEALKPAPTNEQSSRQDVHAEIDLKLLHKNTQKAVFYQSHTLTFQINGNVGR
jgi:hypothetical protein